MRPNSLQNTQGTAFDVLQTLMQWSHGRRMCSRSKLSPLLQEKHSGLSTTLLYADKNESRIENMKLCEIFQLERSINWKETARNSCGKLRRQDEDQGRALSITTTLMATCCSRSQVKGKSMREVTSLYVPLRPNMTNRSK